MTCEHLLTVQHDLFVQSEQVGGPGRPFKANSQYEYSEVVNVSRVTEIPGSSVHNCFTRNYIFWPILAWFTAERTRRITVENVLYDEQNDTFLEGDSFQVTHIESGETKTGSLVSFIPEEGTNQYRAQITINGVTLRSVFFIHITDGLFTNIINMQVIADYPSGSYSPVASGHAVNTALPQAYVNHGDGTIDALVKEFTSIYDQEPADLQSDFYTRDEHTYQINGSYIKRYYYEDLKLGIVYAETLAVVSDCVPDVPPQVIKLPCCPVRGWGRYFRIVCGDYSYLIHETDAFITTIPIAKEDQDAVKKINANRMDDSVVIGTTGNYDGFTWKPCPKDIWKQANTTPM